MRSLSVVKHFQEYKEPDESSSASAQQRKPLKSPEGEVVLLPLGETTLTHNMGVPIIVVITKVSSSYVVKGSGVMG